MEISREELWAVLKLQDELGEKFVLVEERLHMTVYPPTGRKLPRVVGIARPDDPAISYGLFGPSTSEELPQ